MYYPIISYKDGTEVTASRPDNNGEIRVYTEKFSDELDSFIYLEIALPGAKLISSKGYTPSEIEAFVRKYLEMQEDIISYVKEKEKQIA